MSNKQPGHRYSESQTEPASSQAYRRRIYHEYATLFQDATNTFDPKLSERWDRAYNYYLRGWLPESRKARVVDLACGGGRLLHLLKTAGFYNVCGVDISPEQVHLARQVVRDVIQADLIGFLESNRQSFDLITGLDIIEHFFKPEVLRFLDACHAALKPGARLILQTPNADSPWGMMHRYNDFTHEVAFNPNALSRLMRLAGFENIETREMGPVPYGYSATSSLRFLIWQSIRAALKVWNLAETGSAGSGVLTRVFIISGTRV
jgi:2-polyprenyl-3-methyl-5-hydroxy-6-metoxy-1,4-benzoquinol methylase